MKTKTLIQFRNLSKVYSEGKHQHVVFQDLNDSINEGEFVVLLGRSGSGKSTLLNLISAIDLPTQGDVIINGINLTELNEHERTLFRRRHIGFVFQHFNLIPTLSIEENLLLPLQLNQRVGQASHDKAINLLDDLGLKGKAKSYPDRLSGGEQQRVAIARALIHDPMVILADEPTGNLDLETGKEVLEILDHLVSESGTTMLMVTHSPEVVGMADRILKIHQGQLHIAKTQ